MGEVAGVERGKLGGGDKIIVSWNNEFTTISI